MRFRHLLGAALLAPLAVRPSLDGPHAELPETPGPRSQPALLYDGRRVLLLDGTYPAVQRGRAEVWSWDGATWTLVTDSGPPPRHAAAAAFDARRGVVVSYGGRVGRAEAVDGGTWEWDGHRWALAADTGVGRRDHHAIAYDAARGVTVMFGGGPFPRPSGAWATDTWAWDGTRWARVATAGPVGRVAAMVYDAGRREIVLFGGVGRAASPGAE